MIDLEARRAGQVSMLGMSVTATWRRDGAPFEYVAYFITDPEGNAIELYTPPKP